MRGQEVVGGFRRLWIFDERRSRRSEGQAHGSLESDSAGAEPTIMMLFAGNDLSIKDAAPKEDG